jgi:hypothetical protein
MEGQSDPILRSEILRNMIWSWRGFDGPAALAAIDALPEAEGVDRSKLRALLMERIPVHRQLEVLDDFPLPDREAFFTTHGQTLSSEMPEGIFASIMGLPESVGRDKAMTSVLQQWAQRDPLRAVEAVSKLDAPEVEAHAFRQVAFGWSSGDSLRASQWVDSLPPGPNRDAASAGLAEELATEQPDMAFRWAESIDHVSLRRETLRQVLAAWRNDNPQAAESALRESGLNEADRQALAPTTNASQNP